VQYTPRLIYQTNKDELLNCLPTLSATIHGVG